MVPVCLPCMAKCLLLYINVFPSSHLPQSEVIHASPFTCLLHTWTFTAPVTDQESTDCVKRWCLCLQMLRERSWFGILFFYFLFFFIKKGRQCKQTEEQKNPLTSPSGGRSTNPPFSGPYLLNTWSRGFSYHEIPYMIYMVENMKHFNCAHACWFLHNVPTESDDVRIISCSLCRAISQPLCQKGLGDTEA